MAITFTRPYETPQGIILTSSYWRWVSLGIDVSGSSARVTLYGYVNEEAFNAGKEHIGQRVLRLDGAAFAAVALSEPTGATLSDTLSEAVYAYALANDSFFREPPEDLPDVGY